MTSFCLLFIDAIDVFSLTRRSMQPPVAALEAHFPLNQSTSRLSSNEYSFLNVIEIERGNRPEIGENDEQGETERERNRETE